MEVPKTIKNWINPYHGMELHEGYEKNKRDNENGILFLVEHYSIKSSDEKLPIKDILEFQDIVESLQTYDESGNQIEGLYDRGAGESKRLPKDKLRTISHDNLTAIAAFSNKYNLPFAKHIAKYGLKNLFRYDNVYPKNPRWKRIQRPRDICYWLYCAKIPVLWMLFFPFFFITNIASCLTKRDNTSGKLLVYVRMEHIRKNCPLMQFTKFICYSILRYKYGDNWLYELMKIYFKDKNHPNRVMLEE